MTGDLNPGGVPELGPGLRDRMAHNLASHDRSVVAPGDRRAAAVAITVSIANGVPNFILTRRSSSLRAHSNQFALPGGRLDPGEDAPHAARRELEEEIAVATAQSDVLGLLDDYETRSGYVITPVVLWVDDIAAMQAQPDEVDEIYVIGLAELFGNDSPRWITIDESPRPVLQLPLRDRLIHAPTGALLWQFREVALAGRLVRTSEVEEPVWAWS